MEVVASTASNSFDVSDPSLSVAAAQVAGPLLIANVLTWGLWGVLCAQLYLFLLSASREDRERPPNGQNRTLHPFVAAFTSARRGNSATGLGMDGKGEKRRRFRGRVPEEEINPWTVSIAVPPNGFNHHERFSSTTSDPYISPTTADEAYVAHGERKFPPRANVYGSASGGIAQYPSRPTSSSKLKSKSSAGGLFAPDTDALLMRSLRKQMVPGTFVRTLMYVLFALVTVQVLLVTVQAWRIIVDSSLPHTPREGIVATDVIGSIVFVLSVIFFAHSLYLTPSSSPIDSQPSNRSSLRPLSLLQAKAASQSPYTFNINYDTYQHDNIVDQQQADRTGSAGRRTDPCYAGDGHVQPIPSKWTQFRRCLRASLGVNGRRLASMINLRYLQPIILVTAAFIIGLCEIINGAKLLNRPPPVGAPPLLNGNGFLSAWLAGTIIIDVFICFCLITSLITSRALVSHSPSWLGRAMRVLGEAGVAQLLVAILSLVLIAAWKDGPISTVPILPSQILPALYVNTVFLNVAQSYTSNSIFSTSASGSSGSDIPKTSLIGGKDDIEMGIRDMSRPNSTAAQRVIRLGASAFDATLSGTNSSTDTAAIRAAALAYGAEQRERENAIGGQPISGGVSVANPATNGSSAKAASPIGPGAGAAQLASLAPSSGGAGRLHLERDTLGEGSNAAKMGSGSAGLAGTGRSDGPVGSTAEQQGDAPTAAATAGSAVNAAKRMSGYSGMSHGALSLELPVFRKGRRVYDIDMPYDWYEDDDDSDSYLSSVDGDGGTWDYGYALNLAMQEREKERQERERATNAAATTNSTMNLTGGGTNVGGKLPMRAPRPRSVRNSYPEFPRRSRSMSRRRSAHPLGHALDADAVSINSYGSRRSRHRQSYMPGNYHHHYHHHHFPPGARTRPLPPTPDDTSIMIISGPLREPSIAEPSLYKAASVAATRASTGSMWSSYTYPKPMAFPDLDEDLQDINSSRMNVNEGGGFYYDPDPSGAGSAAMGDTTEQDLGDLSAHPYAAAADEDDERRVRLEESNKRRWKVHPLKRMVEMGRFKK